jgi:MFS family permease
VRRLLALVCAVVLVDTILYAALAPLLPRYADEFGLSKTTAGLLVAAYGTGVLLGAVPAGIAAARYGPRRAVLVGLMLVAAASVAFGFASSGAALGLARLLQGFGSSLSWAGGLAWLVAGTPRERRGEMLGTALGAAVFGALLGPILGAFADVAGPEVAFGGVAAGCLVLAVVALRSQATPGEPVEVRRLASVASEPRLAGGLYLIALPALLFGVLVVLVPLRLDGLGWGAVAIGALFVAGAALEAVLAPLLGRFSDRRGRLLPVRVALVSSAILSLALAWAGRASLIAVLVLGATLAYGAFYAPSMALISDGADRAGLAQGLAFGLMNAFWAIGNAAGPAVGGALADLAGDALPFVLLSVVCVGTLVLVRPRRISDYAAYAMNSSKVPSGSRK